MIELNVDNWTDTIFYTWCVWMNGCEYWVGGGCCLWFDLFYFFSSNNRATNITINSCSFNLGFDLIWFYYYFVIDCVLYLLNDGWLVVQEEIVMHKFVNTSLYFRAYYYSYMLKFFEITFSLFTLMKYTSVCVGCVYECLWFDFLVLRNKFCIFLMNICVFFGVCV